MTMRAAIEEMTLRCIDCGDPIGDAIRDRNVPTRCQPCQANYTPCPHCGTARDGDECRCLLDVTKE